MGEGIQWQSDTEASHMLDHWGTSLVISWLFDCLSSIHHHPPPCWAWLLCSLCVQTRSGLCRVPLEQRTLRGPDCFSKGRGGGGQEKRDNGVTTSGKIYREKLMPGIWEDARSWSEQSHWVVGLQNKAPLCIHCAFISSPLIHSSYIYLTWAYVHFLIYSEFMIFQALCWELYIP